MERSAEWLRGAIEALNRAQRDFTVTVPELQAEYVALLADAEARESFPIPDTLPAVPEAREAGDPTAAEVIEELHGCFDTIKHLSADIGTESGDIAVNGVALLGLAKIARWKEANHGK